MVQMILICHANMYINIYFIITDHEKRSVAKMLL